MMISSSAPIIPAHTTAQSASATSTQTHPPNPLMNMGSLAAALPSVSAAPHPNAAHDGKSIGCITRVCQHDNVIPIPKEGTVTTISNILVSARSNVKSVAGAIAHRMRGGSPTLTALAMGTASINQAVKAIAVARDFLASSHLDLHCQAEHRKGEHRYAMMFTLTSFAGTKPKTVDSAAPIAGTTKVFRVSAESEPKNIAGLIAKQSRDGTECFVFDGIGANAVYNLVASVTYARRFLRPDGWDLSFQPEFVHVLGGWDDSDEQRSAIRFTIRRIASPSPTQ